jgi:hypothetical protein
MISEAFCRLYVRADVMLDDKIQSDIEIKYLVIQYKKGLGLDELDSILVCYKSVVFRKGLRL